MLRYTRLGVQVAVSIALVAMVQALSVGRVEPFHTYLYLFSWGPFLWAVDRALVHGRGRNYFGNPSSRDDLLNYARLGACSVTVWLVFEALNFRLLNWLYIGVPTNGLLRWPGYVLSYATVLPGMLFLADLLSGFAGQVRGPVSTDARRASTMAWPAVVGAVMLALPLWWPAIFFPLIWSAFLFLLDPFVTANGGRSLLDDWRRKDFGLTRALLTAGLLCGVFWEACNYLAGAKWVYDVPFVGFLKIFEMPVLGFFGFPVFALSGFVMAEGAHIFWRQRSTMGRWIATIVTLLFWILVFIGIDRTTVRVWSGP